LKLPKSGTFLVPPFCAWTWTRSSLS